MKRKMETYNVNLFIPAEKPHPPTWKETVVTSLRPVEAVVKLMQQYGASLAQAVNHTHAFNVKDIPLIGLVLVDPQTGLEHRLSLSERADNRPTYRERWQHATKLALEALDFDTEIG